MLNWKKSRAYTRPEGNNSWGDDIAEKYANAESPTNPPPCPSSRV